MAYAKWILTGRYQKPIAYSQQSIRVCTRALEEARLLRDKTNCDPNQCARAQAETSALLDESMMAAVDSPAALGLYDKTFAIKYIYAGSVKVALLHRVQCTVA